MDQTLTNIAQVVAARLRERKHTVAVAESSAGGLISAALLSVPGASDYYLGGGVVYTAKAFRALIGIPREALVGMRSSTEPYALLLARTMRDNLTATWGLSETGAAGPTGNGYGDAAGHSCIGIAGAEAVAMTLETGKNDRFETMHVFAVAALNFFLQNLSR